MRIRLERDGLELRSGDWEFLPFRFERFSGERVLVTNLVGEHVFLSSNEFEAFATKQLRDPAVLRRLRGKHLIRAPQESLPVELLAMKTRTRFRRLANFTSLHMFVVTLRCEHSCQYCQVSRQTSSKIEFDMSPETAERAVAMAFTSPSPAIKIEFQGGEPLLNLDLIESTISQALATNRRYGKDLAFVIATNLALLDERALQIAADHNVYFSTSLDGPEDLHNKNRPRPGGDSWRRTIDGIDRIRNELGPERVAALMTTTEASLGRGREVVDCYVEHGFRDVFLRPISPYGFATRPKTSSMYDGERWLQFYEDGLDYILELNLRGTAVTEVYASIILKKMLTNDDPGYVDLTSPAGIGIGGLVYNYDGDVYASDEGRMLAEMKDATFRLGNLHRESYSEMMTSDALLDPLEISITHSAPMCSECAFEPFCGADPVFHHTTAGDFLGRKPTSEFCNRNMRIFRMLLDRYESSAEIRDIFRQWAAR
jgi:uncharacterized protein